MQDLQKNVTKSLSEMRQTLESKLDQIVRASTLCGLESESRAGRIVQRHALPQVENRPQIVPQNFEAILQSSSSTSVEVREMFLILSGRNIWNYFLGYLDYVFVLTLYFPGHA